MVIRSSPSLIRSNYFKMFLLPKSDRLLETQLTSIAAEEVDIHTNLQKSEALRQSTLKKAFAGELVPQDTEDEPAAELLARIRAERAAKTNGGATAPLPEAEPKIAQGFN